MNWNRPRADEVVAPACGLRPDSTCAVAKQVIEARAGRLRRLADGARHRRAARAGIAGIDQHGSSPCRLATGADFGALRTRLTIMVNERLTRAKAHADGMTQQAAMRHKRGGLYFEDFVPGEVVEHRYTRTVTQMDNMLFSNMTLNPQPLHIDRHFCEQETEWGQPLMNSLFTLGLMIGMSVSDITVGTTIANLGMTRREIPASAVRRRHRARHHRDHRQARIEVAARRRHRRIPSPRLQPGRQAGRRMPPPGFYAHAAEVSFVEGRRRTTLDLTVRCDRSHHCAARGAADVQTRHEVQAACGDR